MEKTHYNHFFTLIQNNMENFSPLQKKVGEFFLKEPDLLACLSISEIAKRTKTSQATIIRFCRVLGFDGFLDFSKHIKQALQAQLNGQDRFTDTNETNTLTINGQDFFDAFYNNKTNILELKSVITSDEFTKCINLMEQANNIFLYGVMGAYSLSYMFYNMLYRFMPNVYLLEANNTYYYNNFKNISSDSLIFHIIFPRYPQQSIEMTKQAKEQGAKIVTITNSNICPALSYSDCSLIVPVNSLSFIDTFTEPLALFTAIALKYSQKKPKETLKTLKKYDNFISKNNIFINKL